MVDTRMTITGNLTHDPQLRCSTRTGEPFATIRVAVNNTRFDRASGQWVQTGTTFFDVMCWRSLGANVLNSMHKGDPVIVHGKFRLNEWQAESGPRVDATIDADAVGPNLGLGSCDFRRGATSYGLDRVDEYDPSQEGPQPEPPAGEDVPPFDELPEEQPAQEEVAA
ncbi:hypothetical protein GCM10009584_19900 [Ornithinimicrobium humiphilum]|uniref:Single-stranded DNA-binding protein n=1 Tax=Ornithinimicrobium humiphilum TaxID=125288 RepID=A0A543KM15_9MICO|nr:single-stranded DNA-binding protein [Ornithinimicrobium humiphilum]TQM96074.1 single-strand DNA-binding protein [Ornithinimicrobium humiphilum]